MIYSIVSVVVFFILGIIWTRDSLPNLSLKLLFFGMAAWGMVASDAITLNL